MPKTKTGQMTIKDWEKEVTTMSADKRATMREAIMILQSWDAFDDAFGWTSYATLGAILKYTD